MIGAGHAGRGRGGVLRDRRLLLALGAVVALALGLAFGRAEPSPTAAASTRVVLDTPTSQVIEGAPLGAESLPWRASLLTHLMATEQVKRRLAGQLGVPAGQVAVVDLALSVPEIAASLPKAAAEAASTTAAPYVLTVLLPNESLPIVAIEAFAPDRRAAARLAASAATVLKGEAQDAANIPIGAAESEAARAYPRGRQAFVVEDIAPVRVKMVVEDKPPLKALAVSTFVFGMWGVCLAAGPLLRRLPGMRPRKSAGVA